MKTLTKIFAAIAFVAVLFGTFSNVIIESVFYLRQEAIARQLCENRNNPGMHCNGKCYLKKQLQQNEDQNRQANNYEKFELNWLNDSQPKLTFEPSVAYIPAFSGYQFLLSPGHLRPVDHPPA